MPVMLLLLLWSTHCFAHHNLYNKWSHTLLCTCYYTLCIQWLPVYWLTGMILIMWDFILMWVSQVICTLLYIIVIQLRVELSVVLFGGLYLDILMWGSPCVYMYKQCNGYIIVCDLYTQTNGRLQHLEREYAARASQSSEVSPTPFFCME